MLLAVAGLNPEEVNDTTRRLAGDWSDYPPAERAAFAFTRKQAENPASITAKDVEELQRHWRGKTWQVVWWASRCHYMTTVGDAFQLPLERENPFWKMPGAKKSAEEK